MDTKTLGLLYDTAKQQQLRLEEALEKLDKLSFSTANSTAQAVASTVSYKLEQVNVAADEAVSALNEARDEAEDREKSSHLRSALFFCLMLGLGLGVLFIVKLTLIPSFSEIQDMKQQVEDLGRRGAGVDLVEIDGQLYVRVKSDGIYETKDGRGVYAAVIER